MHPCVDEFKAGTCEWCGDTGSVYTDNSLCEYCDQDIIHCTICKADQHVDSTCRHVFRDEDFEWTGSGAYPPSGIVKKSFFTLLKQMPARFAPELKQAIAASQFHTFLVAPLVGWGGNLELYGMDRDGQLGDRMLEIGEGDEADATADGYRWLASLYNDQTPDASRITLEWIDEFLGGHDHGPH